MANTAIARAISGYLDHLLVERGLAANSISSYRRDLRRYEEFCLSKDLTDPKLITAQNISDFLVMLRLGNEDHPALSGNSAARTLIAVRGFHAFLAKEGLTPNDPARAVKPPSATKQLPKALSFTEIEALLNAVGVDAKGDLSVLMIRDRALLELLYGTGARISELMNLNVDDVSQLSEETPILRLHGKGDKERIVPVGRPALKAVQTYLVRSRPVLASGGKVSRQSAWQILQDAAERAGLAGKVSPHTIRHSFATHLLENGADVRVVQELLGHASVTTTQIYTMVTVDQLREVYATSHPRR
jgi:integrase/recombinase XerD